MPLFKCKKHGKMRLERFLKQIPIFNASGKTIDFEYECTPESLCTTSSAPLQQMTQSGGGLPVAPDARSAPQALIEGMNAQLHATIGAKGAVDGGQQQGPRQPARYYDLSRRNDGEPDKKVCYVCGLDDHERPACPNVICRSCHAIVGQNLKGHYCEPAMDDPSPFLFELPGHLRGLDSDVLEDVECVYCGEMGHFDCRSNLNDLGVKTRELSCSWCAGTGHNGWDCPSRISDRWTERHQDNFPALFSSLGINRKSARSSGGGYQAGRGGFGDGAGSPRVSSGNSRFDDRYDRPAGASAWGEPQGRGSGGYQQQQQPQRYAGSHQPQQQPYGYENHQQQGRASGGYRDDGRRAGGYQRETGSRRQREYDPEEDWGSDEPSFGRRRKENEGNRNAGGYGGGSSGRQADVRRNRW